jgi:hypothetical protein
MNLKRVLIGTAFGFLAVTAIACAAPVTPVTLPDATSPVSVASTCAVAREAFLTGTQAQIEAAMAALQADKASDPMAREYASYYLTRDAGNPDLRQMDATMINTACSLR